MTFNQIERFIVAKRGKLVVGRKRKFLELEVLKCFGSCLSKSVLIVYYTLKSQKQIGDRHKFY